MKIVLIGAGSREFGPTMLRDIVLSDALCQQPLDVVLMDLDKEAVHATGRYADALAKRYGRAMRIERTTDLEEALPGASFVVMAIETRRYFYWAQDFHVPRQLGFRQIYGENGGPGGLFHALRNMGPSLDIARAMGRSCPDAWLLNFTNPLTKLCEAQTRLTSVKTIGLCHGIIHGREQLAKLLGLAGERLETRACGLNHFSWFQSIVDRESSEDLYPLLRDRERQAHWLAEWDEIALSRVLLRAFGLYPSPGANHVGEYVRWAGDLLGSQMLQFFYDPREGHPWETGAVPTFIYNLADHPTDTPLFPEGPLERLQDKAERHSLDPEAAIRPSGELAVPIMEGVSGGADHELMAVNVPNRGTIPNLPAEAVVEVPATASEGAVVPRLMEPLPEAVAALIRTQATINELLVQSFEERSRDRLLQALLLDPTTESYSASVNLIDRMFELQGPVLPKLEWA